MSEAAAKLKFGGGWMLGFAASAGSEGPPAAQGEITASALKLSTKSTIETTCVMTLLFGLCACLHFSFCGFVPERFLRLTVGLL